jgi:hypothetical protein
MKKETNSLTFETFLKNYVKSLSLENTTSLKKLIQEASTSNLRLVEPLILYIRFYELDKTYLKFKNNDLFDKAMSQFILEYPTTATLLTDFERKKAKSEYQKVYNSYIYFKNRRTNESELKTKIINKTLDLIKTKSISKYRLSKELKINPGNLNSYLNHQKVDALSMQKCNSLINYLSRL